MGFRASGRARDEAVREGNAVFALDRGVMTSLGQLLATDRSLYADFVLGKTRPSPDKVWSSSSCRSLSSPEASSPTEREASLLTSCIRSYIGLCWRKTLIASSAPSTP